MTQYRVVPSKSFLSRTIVRRSAWFNLAIVVGLLLLLPGKWLGGSYQAQTKAASNVGQQGNDDVQVLEAGRSVEREIANGQTHIYSLNLATGQFVRFVAEQKSINIKLMLVAPDGKQISEADLTSQHAMESLSAEIVVSGEYRLTVRPRGRSGRYKIWIELGPVVRLQDRKRLDAELLMKKSKSLSEKSFEEKLEKIAKFQQVLTLWREIEDRDWETQTIEEIAVIWLRVFTGQASGKRNLEYCRKAIEYHELAIALNRDAKNQAGEADAFIRLGSTYLLLDQFEEVVDNPRQKSVECYLQALRLSRGLKDPYREKDVLYNLGYICSTLYRYEEAIDFFKQALQVNQSVGDRLGEAQVLIPLSNTYHKAGEMLLALDCREKALAFNESIEDLLMVTILHNGIGAIYDEMGDKQKALDAFYRSRQTLLTLQATKNNSVSDYPDLMINLGAAYSSLGEWQQALGYLSQALEISQTNKDRNAEASALRQIGIVYSKTGDVQKALDSFAKSIKLNRTYKNRVGEAFSLLEEGSVLVTLKQQQRALENYERALLLLKEAGNRALEALALTKLGAIQALLGDKTKSLAFYEQAIQRSQSVNSPSREAAAHYGIARVKFSSGDLVEARYHLDKAIDLAESMRTTVGAYDLRATYLETIQDYYQLYVDLLMRLHQDRGTEGYAGLALQMNERARARSLLDMLKEGRADIRQGVDASLLERERKLLQQLNEKAWRFNGNLAPEQRLAIEKEANILKMEYDRIQAALRQNNPRYAALTQPQPLKVQEIQQLLDADSLLLEFSLGEEQSWLWLVTSTKIESHPLPPRAEIEDAAARLYRLLVLPERSAETESELRKQSLAISKMLLGPVAAQLGKKRLVIVAASALQFLPFAALPIPHADGKGHRPLLVEHEIVNLPSASTLGVLRRENADRTMSNKSIAVLADPVFDQNDPRVKAARLTADTNAANATPNSPGEQKYDLPTAALNSPVRPLRDFRGQLQRLFFSRNEAEAIYAAAPAGTGFKALDFRANRETAMSTDLSQYRIVHFATHGLLNTQHPELSGLALSLVDEKGQPQDGFLRLHEIYNLKLNADLVVLSACQTALGKEVKGEGLIGLTRGFMYAGAPRVVASLWKVDDVATSELMKRFYRAMLQGKQRPAAALRTAQLEMMQRKQWQSPFYWAAFTLQGEWK